MYEIVRDLELNEEFKKYFLKWMRYERAWTMDSKLYKIQSIQNFKLKGTCDIENL